MDKNSFLNELRKRLSFLPKTELDKTIAYYDEMISDRIDTGMSEQEAVSAVGNIDEIVESVRAEGNYTRTENATDKYNPFVNAMLILGIIALYFALIWDIILSIGFVVWTVVCLILAVFAVVNFGMPAALIFAGAALILISLFLMTIPVSSYIKFGIKRTKESLRR